MNINISHNFLLKEDLEKIHKLLLGSNFPWFFNAGVVYEKTEEKNMFQFTHTFWDNNLGGPTSPFLNELEPLIDKIDPKKIFRIKANLVTRTENNVIHGYHTDYFPPFKCITSVFYVNDNNGFTIFETGEKQKSISNTLVSFNSDLAHSGSSCTDKNVRCVININYEK